MNDNYSTDFKNFYSTQKLEFSVIDPRFYSPRTNRLVDTGCYKIVKDGKIFLFDSDKFIPIPNVVDLYAFTYIEYHNKKYEYGRGEMFASTFEFLNQNFIVKNEQGYLGVVNIKGELVIPMLCNEIIVFESAVIAGDSIYYTSAKPIFKKRIGETISLFKMHKDFLIYKRRNNDLIFINHFGNVYQNCKCIDGVITLYEKGENYIKYNIEKDCFVESIVEEDYDDNYDYSDDGYTDDELRSMYLDAFEGDLSNEWNID